MESSEASTYTALSGIRKQDVGDAERLLSASVAAFLAKQGYVENLDTSRPFTIGM